MPMYYFHLLDDETVSDVDGTELPDASAARAHAVGVAHELMYRRSGMLQRNWTQWIMQVQDGRGNEVFSFRLNDFKDD